MNEIVLAQMPGADGPSPFGPVVIMGLIFAFFYFLVMRPQQQKEREKENMRAALKKSDEVVTTGGLYGKVIDVKGPVVMLEIAQNVRVRVERRSIDAMAGSAPPKGEAKEKE